MRKIYFILAILFAAIVIFSTAIYIPKGYTAIARDGESLYSEGIHLFQKYPFEQIQMIQLSKQCDTYDKDVLLNDGSLVTANINVCWEITKDLNQIKRLHMLYDHGSDSSNYKTLLIYSSVIPSTYKVFYRLNASNLDPYDLNVSHDILNMTQHQLDDTGIIITEISISLPDFGPFESAIKQRNEKKKQAEAEMIKAKEEINRLEQAQNNTANTTWINDVPENQADFFIQSTKDALYARLVEERITGIVPTLSFSKGPSRYGVPGFIGIYSP